MLLAALNAGALLVGVMLVLTAVRGVLLFRSLDTPPPAAARRSFLPDDQEGWQRFRVAMVVVSVVLGVAGVAVVVVGLGV